MLHLKGTMRSGVMKRVSGTALLIGLAVMAGTGFAGVALAQDRDTQNAQSTPRNWNYEIKDGKRVPRAIA